MQNLCFKRFTPLVILLACITGVAAQTYNDGPMQLQVRVRDIATNYSATDVNFPGIGLPDELTYKVWARDNANIDGPDWVGGNCLTVNFNPPGNSPDFNTTIFNFTYTGATVPQFFDIRGDFWEDDSDDATCQGSRCTFESNVGCACTPFGCLYSQEDDEHCDANPFATALDYRQGPPCQWYDHGYVAGACGSKYQPRIESFWRYTKGTSCSDAIALGALPPGGSLTHYNSNICYSNNFTASAGNDVFYEFSIGAPTGVTISLCASTTFNTVLYLLDASCGQVAMNDNSCGIVSEIKANICTPGTYRVVVDGALANSQGAFTLLISDDPSALLSVTVSATDITCNGGSNGTATATPVNGTAPFTYTWLPNAGSGATITGLSGGTYSVTVTDNTGCTATGSVVVNEPTVISFTTTFIEPTCNGGTDGSITVTASGGTPPYQYSSDGGNIFQSSNVLAGLGGGSYNVVVRDSPRCTTTDTVVLTEPVAIQPNLTVTHISCNGANDGSVVSNPTNGTPPYEYSLDNGPFVPGNSFTSIPAGFHLFTVHDSQGCEKQTGFNILQPNALTGLVSAVTPLTCNGDSTGSFFVTGVGGAPPYTYSLDDMVYQASGAFTNLPAGNYTVYTKDSSGCKSINQVTISQPAVLVASRLFQIDISCNGSTDGVAVITATGGTVPYGFSDDYAFWDATSFFDRLVAGTYTYYVRDANGCEDSVDVTITEPDTLAVSAGNVVNASCLGVADGSIEVIASGGTPPYKYSLNGGAFQSSNIFSSLTAGDYDFTVRDDNFCEKTQSLTIGQLTTITFSVSKTNITCSGDSSGILTVTNPSGGQAPYTYSLDGIIFQTSDTFSNLPAGNYTLTVKDDIGCLGVQQEQVTEPAPLVITLVITTPATCFNTTDGSAEIDVQGGNGPYSFSWSNGNITQNLLNVLGGDYTVTVTDQTQCTAEFSVTIGKSPDIFIEMEHFQNVTCAGEDDAVINVSVLGGTPGYDFSWNNGIATTEDLVNIGPGMYTFLVTDANNCTLADTFTVISPLGLIIDSVNVSNSTCASGNDGTITIVAAGGTAPIGYSIDGFSFEQNSVFAGLTAGVYPVIVKDANGCTASRSATVQDGTEIFYSYGQDYEIKSGQFIQLTPILIPADVIVDSVAWEPATGLSCTNCLEPIASPTDTTIYTVTLYDENGCVAEAVVRVFVTEDWQIFFPNIFSPNGDGANDHFDFYSFGTTTVEVSVFNRYGGRVYHNSNQVSGEGQGWDGTYNGKEAQQGAYVYLVNVVFTNEEERQKTGTITLVR